MSHFAKVENGIVTQVIVAEQDVIDSGLFGTGWVQTSYNTSGGHHPEGRPLRKNYAGVGFTYDSTRDAFIPPKPEGSWVLDEETCLWVASSTTTETITVDNTTAEVVSISDNSADSVIVSADSVNGVV